MFPDQITRNLSPKLKGTTKTAMCSSPISHPATCMLDPIPILPILILFDLSVTFDTVNHHILLSILSNMGIYGLILTWKVVRISPQGCSRAQCRAHLSGYDYLSDHASA